MNKTANTRLIGLFVLGALSLAVALTLAFGGGNHFGKVRQYVIHFDGSVTGLNTGAAVRLKGVGIGRVTDILVQYDMQNRQVLTPVLVEIDLDKVMETSGNHTHHHPDISELITLGLRARLSVLSMVTGQLYVDLNFLPQQPVRLTGSQLLDLPEIPTLPSSKEELENTLHHVASEIQEMPLKDTMEAMRDTLKRVEHLLAKPETAASIDNLNQTLLDLQHLVRHLDSKVDRTSREGQALLTLLNQRLPPLLDSGSKAMNSIETFIEPGSELADTLHEFRGAAHSLHQLTESLERNPDSLLFGRRQKESD